MVWHTHEIGNESDEKLIGVYRTHEDAKAAIGRLSDKLGFRDAPEGFEVSEYVLGKDHWTEGYISQVETNTPLLREAGTGKDENGPCDGEQK